MTTLFVASTGGHLKQLHQLHRRLRGLPEPYRWVTFDRPQSRSLLSAEAVDYVWFVGSRDPVAALRRMRSARRIVRKHDVSAVVSTGSAIALPFFVAGRAHGARCVYIESAARSDGPSITGRMAGYIPGVRRFTQYRAWADESWTYAGSVFDAFVAEPGEAPAPAIRRVVVTLGTLDYGFERLVRRLREILPPECEVLWQVGGTSTEGLGIAGHAALPADELSAAKREADVVVAHAGVGSALAALEVGKMPVLVPRRPAFGEHVDDHQIQIATELERRGLAVRSEADDLDLGVLEQTLGRRVRTLDERAIAPIDVGGGGGAGPVSGGNGAAGATATIDRR